MSGGLPSIEGERNARPLPDGERRLRLRNADECVEHGEPVPLVVCRLKDGERERVWIGCPECFSGTVVRVASERIANLHLPRDRHPFNVDGCQCGEPDCPMADPDYVPPPRKPGRRRRRQ